MKTCDLSKIDISKNSSGYWTCVIKGSRGAIVGGGLTRDGAASDAIAKLQASNLELAEIDEHFASLMRLLSNLEWAEKR